MSKGVKALTLAQAEAIAEALRKDDLLDVDSAAIDAGASPGALKQARWRYRHEKSSDAEADIVETVERAVAEQCRSLLRDGKAAFAAGQRTGFIEWVLERRAPLLYGRKQIVALTGEEGGPVKTESNVKLASMDSEELLSTYIQALKDKGGQ